jgi:F420-dependent oxidoreductase-like protein
MEAMAGGTIGIHVQEPNAAATVAAIKRYEAAGVQAAWLTTGGVAPDGLTVFAAAAVETERILLGTCIIPTFPRHPLVVVQQVNAIAALAPGRFRLGLGPSHKPAVEASYGFEFRAPLGHLREYITIVKQIFDIGSVDFDGKHYHAHGRMAGPIEPAVPVMASALRVKAFRLCGEIADGAITWVCPLPYVRDTAIPALLEGAAAAGRTPPPMVAHVPFCLSEDAEAARAAARQQLAGYPRLPYYAQMMADAGLPEAAKGEWSEAMVDAIVPHGNEQQVGDRLRAFLQAGCGELIAAPIVVGDRQQALGRAAGLLADLAKS